eukprot:NODE_6330_length_363_cov_34.745223_g5609_i0.p2 GENE.NODE_6330_length_363_cov_34.745223_g5609_i0~~NODE_6330_length_363_cov_34.745223_g5609_i0.p2  ORF type:complete len:55 (-),score=9.36 NODE_6330_length_363_cov_34.745223_g5609_i0:73-237(-)
MLEKRAQRKDISPSSGVVWGWPCVLAAALTLVAVDLLFRCLLDCRISAHLEVLL